MKNPIRKRLKITVDQTTKKTTSVQSNKEPVNKKTASTQFDIKPTKQYLVLGEIQKNHISFVRIGKESVFG